MIRAVSGAFARQKTVPPLSHYPPRLKETAQERMVGLVKAGFPSNDLRVADGKLFLILHETDGAIEL